MMSLSRIWVMTWWRLGCHSSNWSECLDIIRSQRGIIPQMRAACLQVQTSKVIPLFSLKRKKKTSRSQNLWRRVPDETRVRVGRNLLRPGDIDEIREWKQCCGVTVSNCYSVQNAECSCLDFTCFAMHRVHRAAHYACSLLRIKQYVCFLVGLRSFSQKLWCQDALFKHQNFQADDNVTFFE